MTISGVNHTKARLAEFPVNSTLGNAVQIPFSSYSLFLLEGGLAVNSSQLSANS